MQLVFRRGNAVAETENILRNGVLGRLFEHWFQPSFPRFLRNFSTWNPRCVVSRPNIKFNHIVNKAVKNVLVNMTRKLPHKIDAHVY